MKTLKLPKLIVAGLALAGITIAPSLRADVTLVIAGGNATRAVQYEAASNILTGFGVSVLNANTRSYTNGTLIGSPGLGKVTLHFALNGALGGLQNLRDQTTEVLAIGSPAAPQLAVSGSYPETVGIDGSIFNYNPTLVVPFGYIINPTNSPLLANVTNLTQRQVAYLQGASGQLPSLFLGGTGNTNDWVYVIGRDNAAAVRQVIDANIYFTGTPAFWTTNRLSYQTNTAYNALYNNVFSNTVIGGPVPNPLGGHNAGGLVIQDIKVLNNAIGTVASGDFTTYRTLSYEGYQPTKENIAKGFYPIWGYENWYYKNTGAGQPTANQLTVINALRNAITDYTYQHTPGNAFDAGKFVPLGDLEVYRDADGGPIKSLLY